MEARDKQVVGVGDVSNVQGAKSLSSLRYCKVVESRPKPSVCPVPLGSNDLSAKVSDKQIVDIHCIMGEVDEEANALGQCRPFLLHSANEVGEEQGRATIGCSCQIGFIEGVVTHPAGCSEGQKSIQKVMCPKSWIQDQSRLDSPRALRNFCVHACAATSSGPGEHPIPSFVDGVHCGLR